jgi:glycosyltransferase involved in cell wall biosynthesis
VRDPTSILVLTNQLVRGGAERYALTLSRWLAARGVHTVLAADPDVLVDEIDPSVVYLPTPLRDVRWSLPRAVVHVARIVRAHRPDAIVASSVVTAAVARAATLGRTPVIAVAHGWPEAAYRRVAPLLRVAHRVVAVSDEVADRLAAAGLPRARLRVVPNGVDLDRFADPALPDTRARREAVRAREGIRPDEVVLINVGRYVPQKAQHRLVELAAGLPGTRLWIVGWGEGEAALRAAIDAAGATERVRLLVQRADVPDLLAAADVFVSASTWEGMPLATIEAMAAGLPVVATDVEGIRALVDETVGARVPTDDPDALRGGVAALVADPTRRRVAGEAARARAHARFSHEASCGGLLDVVRELLP